MARLELFGALRPFVSEQEQPAWGRCIALNGGWAFATNNMTIAGAACCRDWRRCGAGAGVVR